MVRKEIEFQDAEWGNIEQWTKMIEKAPGDAIKEVIRWHILPYKADKGAPKKGLYTPKSFPGYEKPETKECWILGATTIYGESYTRVVVNGHLMKVPSECVKEEI